MFFVLLLAASGEPRAVDVLPREMLAKSGDWVRPNAPRVNLGLTVGLAGSLRLVQDSNQGNGSMDAWIGVRYPKLVRPTPFLSLGVDLGFRDYVRPKTESEEWENEVDRTDTYTSVVPEVRAGYVVAEPSLGIAMLVFQLYAFTGYRIANDFEPAAVRIGLGMGSALPLQIAGACMVPLPIPTTVEVMLDLPSKGDATPGLRLGWVF